MKPSEANLPEQAEVLSHLPHLSSLTKKELFDWLRSLPPAQLEVLDRLLLSVTAAWSPLPGPQTLAYQSEADFLLYGGAAGGGKTDLLLGTALLHRRAVIFRRVFPLLSAIIERSRMLYKRYGASDGTTYAEYRGWKFPQGNTVHFDSIQYEKDVSNYQGNPYDFYGWDELTEFTEYMFRFVTGWLRPLDIARHKRKARVVATCNPPTTAEGMWILDYWAPWLDEQYPNPAGPGELRWFTTIDGKDKEVDPEPFKYKGELIVPKSRTFIPASIDDNPFLVEVGYRSQLQQLPEPLRSKLLFGDFKAGISDDVLQLIPTAWVKEAQRRWREEPVPQTAPDALGVDVARGGRDRTVLTPNWGTYFGKQIEYPGKFTADGDKVASVVLLNSNVMTTVRVDVIGVGCSAYDSIKKIRRTIPMNASEGTDETDKSHLLHFRNQRSLWYWRLREALDPKNGDDLAIPDDKELLADLCAPRVTVERGIIKVESKDDIMERIGRSPDKGDSLVYAHSKGKTKAGQGLLDLLSEEYKKFQEEEEAFKKRYGDNGEHHQIHNFHWKQK
jgi:hypothetical protein